MTATTTAPATFDQAELSFDNVSVTSLQDSIKNYLRYSLGTTLENASAWDLLNAVGLTAREFLLDRMASTETRHQARDHKRVYYLSMEFLIGKSLENNLINLRLMDRFQQAISQLGRNPQEVFDAEPDAGLGNGGLGRLAACFIDSMATIGLAGYGYGINYEYGLFKQQLKKGWQHEQPDNWRADGTPWQIERPGEAVVVPVYGRVDQALDRHGNHNPMWVDWQAIIGIPHDMPVAGYGAETVNYLRLYSARGSHEFDIEVFNGGDYLKAVEQKIKGETISKVLYPSDAIAAGKELRLIQEYFLVACSVRDLVRRHEDQQGDIQSLPDHVAIQLNDTHPALTVAELMRFLVDERNLVWEDAWDITQRTLAYTNHTLLPEALEKWPVELMRRVLPRHLELILEINRRFMAEVSRRWPGDVARLQRMSLIEESGEQQVRMCNLAIIGSHSVNGVSALHSELVKSDLVPDFYELSPEKFNNKTNGITPRRWLLQCNPRLSNWIADHIGSGWVTHLDELQQLADYANDAVAQSEFLRIKHENKVQLAGIIRETTGTIVDPRSLFDVQVKRIHEYKRQLLNALRIIHDYYAIVEDGVEPACPRTYIFGGKAAPGYWAAKQIIGLINGIADKVNHCPRASQWMKVVYLPNYRVSLAERIFPASDLSEQISTAGFEASGTGNMKFALNGALTIGTLDGANVEIGEEVGAENIFIFGLKTEQIADWYQHGGLRPQDHVERNPHFGRILSALRGDEFSPRDYGQFAWIADYLTDEHDRYFHLADLQSYITCQEQVADEYSQPTGWAEKAIVNVARVGKFSSDRTIREYAEGIWGCRDFD